MRHIAEEDKITTIFPVDMDVEFNFSFHRKADEQERKTALAIFALDGTIEQVVCALWSQFKDGIGTIVRVDLVKEVNVEISDVYYPKRYPKGNDINMTFYTDYVAKKIKREQGICDLEVGFVCCNTIGRFSRRSKKFYQISNGMLSGYDFM